MKRFLPLLFVLLLFPSCDTIMAVLETAAAQSGTVAPSEGEVVTGLKKALEIGVDYAVTTLHKKDGYYGNQIVKILLPDEVNKVLNEAMNNSYVKRLGMDKVLQKKIDEVVLAINRSAEAAAVEAKPIFVDAIKTMTITDGMSVLKGVDVRRQTAGFDSLAATHYLEFKTRQKLFTLYKPKIKAALDKDLGLGISANKAWDLTMKYYNGYIAPVLRKPKISYTLDEYATNKALDGLFYMVGQEEKKIRQDPYKWSSDIIKKVFGYVKQQYSK